MQNSVRAAERVRPILQAMERSISAARQRRLQNAPPVENPAVVPTPAPIEAVEVSNGETPRLKARPKRATPFQSRLDTGNYHSQAG